MERPIPWTYNLKRFSYGERQKMPIILPTDTCYWLAWEMSEQDYHEIYRLKGRDFDKRLALLVRDFDMLREYAEVTDGQMEFLRIYSHPWSVILPRKNDAQLPASLQWEAYEQISFRVAEACVSNYESWMIRHEFPLFLTSANLSWEPESTTLEQAKSIFPWIEWIDWWICDRPPSDIFRFLPDGEIEYLRRNY